MPTPFWHWRRMTAADLPGVMSLANATHTTLPEREAVFRERLRLFPDGCHVLVLTLLPDDDDDIDAAGEQQAAGIRGYLISHPIRRWQPPALDTLLLPPPSSPGGGGGGGGEGEWQGQGQGHGHGGIPPDADQYYVHDLVVAPSLRGQGHAAYVLRRVLRAAERRYASTCLVSVYGTAAFWRRYGFVAPAEAAPDVGEEDLRAATALAEMLRGYGPDAVLLVRVNDNE